MTLAKGTLESYAASIGGASTVAAQKTAVGAYYDYLTSEGVAYGSLAKGVALDTGDFGTFANDYMTAAGADVDDADVVRVSVALADVAARITDIDAPGDGIIDTTVIATYHYNAFAARSLPPEAWAGSLFEEFAGPGSWLGFAATGTLDADEVEAILVAVTANSTVNGVNARTAMGYLKDTVWAAPGEHLLLSAQIIVGSGASIAINAAIPGDGPDVQDRAEELVFQSRLHTILANSSLSGWLSDEGQELEISNNNTVTYTDPNLSGRDAVQGLHDALKSAMGVDDLDGIIDDADTLVINATDGTDTFTFEYVPAEESGQTFNSLSTNVFFFEEGATGHGITYASLGGSNGIHVDLLAGTATVIGEGSPKDFLNGAIQHVTGSGNADEIVADGQSSSIDGGNGDDTITPGDGNDTISGGANNDHIVLTFQNSAQDTVSGFNTSGDVLDLTAFGILATQFTAMVSQVSSDTVLNLNGHVVTLTGVTASNVLNYASNGCIIGLIGGAAGMVVDGTSSANNIISTYNDAQGDHVTANNDTVTGNAGTDTIAAGAGSDFVVWNRGDGADILNETVNGTDKNILRLVGVNFADVALNTSSNGTTLTVTVAGTGGATLTLSTQWGNSGGNLAFKFLQLDDRVLDLDGDLRYSGGSGNDAVRARADVARHDTIDGGSAGGDTLYGGQGDDTLTGGSGNDALYGGLGDDTVNGGVGNDNLQGGAGSDTFVIAPGDGTDTITEVASTSDTNVIKLTGITVEQVFLDTSSDGKDLFVNVFQGTTTSQAFVTINDQWVSTGSGYKVSRIDCDNGSIDLTGGTPYKGQYYGTTTTAESIYARSDADTNDTMDSGAGNDTVRGYGGNDSITGGSGANVLYGGTGNDTLTGGTATDTLYGEAGSDTVDWTLDDGADIINETASTTDTNVLVLHGVNKEHVHLKSINDATTTAPFVDLAVVVGEEGAAVGLTIENQWVGATGADFLFTSIVCDDGTIALTSGINYSSYRSSDETIRARDDAATNDTLTGDSGNDDMFGYDGDDTYNSVGWGDGIYDTSGSNTVELPDYAHLTNSSNNGVFYESEGYDSGTHTYYGYGQSVFIDDYFLHTADWTLI